MLFDDLQIAQENARHAFRNGNHMHESECVDAMIKAWKETVTYSTGTAFITIDFNQPRHEP